MLLPQKNLSSLKCIIQNLSFYEIFFHSEIWSYSSVSSDKQFNASTTFTKFENTQPRVFGRYRARNDS